ncbi:MAG: hypothetical protein CMH54_15395 [Myxococcales bacterium]|nr:hypothetical protein [Myxococcales bacterium]
MRDYPSSSGIRPTRRYHRGFASPSGPGRLLQKARQALHERRPEEALQCTEEAMQHMGRVGELLLIRAAALLDMGHPRIALSYLDTAIDMDPKNGDLAVERCRVYVELGDVLGAADDLRELTELYPSDPEILHLRAMSEELLGNNTDAERFYRDAAALDDNAFPSPFRVPAEVIVSEARAILQALPNTLEKQDIRPGLQVFPVPPMALSPGEPVPFPPTMLGVCLEVGDLNDGGMVRSIADPICMILFQRNIERSVRSMDELKDQIRQTIIIELAHHLKLSESETNQALDGL